MRSWTYSYKTSDGLRHEAEMSAPTKDDVYAALRERGIRAIRVDERIAPVVRRGFRGLRKRDWLLLAAVGACLLVTVVVFMIVRVESRSPQSPISSSQPSVVDLSSALEDASFRRLAKSVEGALVLFRESAATLDVALLSDYRLVETNGADFIRAEIARGRRIADAGRRAVRDVYDLLYVTIPSERAAATAAAQRLFGEAMNEIDAFSESLDGDECAIELLVTNRSAWRFEKDEIVWTEPKFAREFSVFRRAGAAKTFIRKK